MARVFAGLEQEEAETQHIAGEQTTVKQTKAETEERPTAMGYLSISAEWRKSKRKRSQRRARTN